MAYATYITDALVCGVKNSNTSDRSFLLFTRDAGMLFASARSVREEKSKQRYALQEFGLVKVTLIRGKSGWRIGSVEALKNYYNDAVSKEARGSVTKIFRSLRRFIQGEENASELFDLCSEGLEYVSKEVQPRQFIDQVVQLRIFHLLGYVADKSVPETLLKTELKELSSEHKGDLEPVLDSVLTKAISVSHL